MEDSPIDGRHQGGRQPQNQQEKKEEAQEKVHQRRGETGCPPVPAGPRAAKEPGSGEENPRADHQTDGLTTELTKLLNESSVDLQQETPSFDGFLWKLMLGLIQAKLSGDCAPFLRMITALYNGMTGHEEETPTMSRSSTSCWSCRG